MNESKKHHFFARFHLKVWAEASDGKIPTCQRVGGNTIKRYGWGQMIPPAKVEPEADPIP